MKDDDALRSRLEAAAGLVQGLPEHLQAAAFGIAFATMRDAADLVAVSSSGRRPRSKSRPQPALAARMKQVGRPKRRGPKGDLEVLIGGGYFREARTMAAVLKHLEGALAKRYSHSDMSQTIVRVVGKVKLQRVQGANGQYEYTSP